MLSAQHATSPCVLDLKVAATNATNPNSAYRQPLGYGYLGRDQQCPIEPSPGRTTASMTKQLTTTIATIPNAQLAPTTISPTAISTGTNGVATEPPVPPPPPPPHTPIAQRPTAKTAAGQLPAITTTAPSPSPPQPQPAQHPPQAQLKQAALQTRTPTSNDASGRSAALERAYVHDVYENCEEPTGSIRPRVAQFLSNLDPGSIVCDVGCGSGRYLTQCNPAICTVGVDRCYRLSKLARSQGGEVALCDNLELPFRDESFDAVLSLAVVHHFATTERRIRALRELARILRIGGRVVITVWALEQRHRRFESQDVLIPWQPPKNRNFNCSDEEDDDDYLPPYHAYTEDSTNSSRSAGDGDSSSLSSSSPGESCYSFVRRAIQKLASGRRHPWFLDSWNSKDTKNDSSLDYEDAKDLPIELRRLEDFEDFTEPPLSAGLKSRSLGSILNPPPRQIVRSRSSVPSLGGAAHSNATTSGIHEQNGHNAAAGVAVINAAASFNGDGAVTGTASLGRRPKLIKQKQSLCDEDYQLASECAPGSAPFHMISSYNSSTNSVNSCLGSRAASGNGGSAYYYRGDAAGNQHFGMPLASAHHPAKSPLSARQMAQASLFLRKQSSLNEELMAGNRIREKERVRKRIQKQISLNEAFLCRSQLFSKRLQVIREGVTSKIKSSTGSLERVTKTGLTKIMENFKGSHADDMDGAGLSQSADDESSSTATQCNSGNASAAAQGPQGNTHAAQHQVPQTQCLQHQHHHHHHQQQQGVGLFQSHFSYLLHKQRSIATSESGPVYYCNKADCATSTGCYCKAYHNDCGKCSGCLAASANESDETKARRHSRESGSDSSKDSLQSDTSIESEDSFASVIFIPKPEQHQQQLNYQQQHSQNSNSSSSNSSSSNGHRHHQLQQQMYGKANTASMNGFGPYPTQQQHHQHHQQSSGGQQQRGSSVPTSPLIMPCPPTPAHSPAAAQTAVTSPPQTVAAVTAAMAILTPPLKCVNRGGVDNAGKMAKDSHNRFNFDVAHIKQQQTEEEKEQVEQKRLQQERDPQVKQDVLDLKKPAEREHTKELRKHEDEAPVKITRQTIKDLPPIPKFRKQQSLQLHRQSFPIVRRSSATSNSSLPTSSIPKLMSLELFNPLTDDLDSDSSEPSSPDSIDSVISAPKSVQSLSKDDDGEPAKGTNSDVANHEDLQEFIKVQQRQYHNGDLKINLSAPNDIILNDDSANILPATMQRGQKQQDCAEFAEQLSAQLMREIEDKNNRIECRSLDGISDIGEYLDDPLVNHKKRNAGEQRDLTALRDELRERRLMLANLSTQPSLQQSPTTSSSASSRSFTIHEEDEEEDEEENERSYTLQLYENCKVTKFDYKRNRQFNLHPETAYLLQDDGDSSIRDDDDMDDFEHDVILEEDEEALEAERKQEQLHNATKQPARAHDNSALSKQHPVEQQQSQQQQPQQQHGEQQETVQRRSTESWEHSNSSTSLDSPSQGGGSTTHHRYYHVFREGELDALINHHVASLHVVSSYYERASWCVVAEKVQVWTI